MNKILSLCLSVFSVSNLLAYEIQEEFCHKLQIDKYLNSYKPLVFEGHVDKEQISFFYDLIANNPDIKKVLEIGFNAGHSAEAFLEARQDIEVVSFDIGKHSSVQISKGYLDDKYPGRLTLILGDSTETIPDFIQKNPSCKFDLIFIDGGHSIEVAESDLKNCRFLANPGAFVIMDDLVPWNWWGKGPTRAWEGSIQSGHLQEVELILSSSKSKRWGLGKYIEEGSP